MKIDIAMSTLVDKPVSIKRLMTSTPQASQAVSDPARAQILELLYHRSLTAGQIADELRDGGYQKALTTIRHHIRVLKAAGLIQVTRVDEVRGTISKQYGTTIRLLNFQETDKFESKEFEQIIDDTCTQVDKIIPTIKAKLPPTQNSHKKEKTYADYLLVEVLNRAITKSLELDN